MIWYILIGGIDLGENNLRVLRVSTSVGGVKIISRFLRGGWKVMLVTVTTAMVMITSMFALSLREPKVTKAKVSKEQLQQLLNQALLSYLKATSTYMDISEQTVTLAEFNSDSRPIEAIFDVSQTFVANFKMPDDDPMLAGKIRWLEDNRAKLTPNEISVAEVLIKQTRKQVQESMTEPFTGYSNWKITADSAEDAISGNFKVYL
ncbi:hypothetical protein [Coprothermobacter proteolyticus]|uniref:hypothetical protein n=1 Tax=Coprothermobacter proteolyticus TaxID=35786 RepID=UPI001F36679F|nr:hypothetical protein [Coprothermobacter proteolyticus]